jgi:hypothetical protein
LYWEPRTRDLNAAFKTSEKEIIMAVTIDDVIEAATNGVIRALDARKATQQGTVTEGADLSTVSLVRSGFIVDVHITAGGIPIEPRPTRGG